tara:strand:+ start:2378 stop:2854 length:477 start_codon:yes stop_codon:yes gene_type:complete
MPRTINITGLDAKSSKKMAQHLNVLLASYQVLYINVRGYHWNIQGTHFFELHEKFEAIYNELLEQLDEIAERILTLGHTPDHNYSDYVKKSQVKEHKNANSHKVCIEGLMNALDTILKHQREIIDDAQECSDDRTLDMLSGYMLTQEKLAWMLKAYLS